MISMLTLAVVVLLVVSMRRPGSPPKSQVQRPGGGDRVVAGTGLKVKRRPGDPERPGVVSYALMKDNKLPTPTQRAVRRVLRPFGRAGIWVYRRFVPPRHDEPTATGGRRARQSAELQNFLDARNREIARRKSEGNKPGPDDRLH